MAVYPGVGERIRKARQAAGITLQQLAERVGLAWETLQRIETEKQGTDLNKIDEIAQALGTKLKFLLPDDDAPPAEDIDKVYLRQRGFSDKYAQEVLNFMDYIKTKQKNEDSSVSNDVEQ